MPVHVPQVWLLSMDVTSDKQIMLLLIYDLICCLNWLLFRLLMCAILLNYGEVFRTSEYTKGTYENFYTVNLIM